ncbi:MAG: nucleotidyltransferase family protein [SAR202 cluster bacterium]|jgi:hypothetical protein|nr:nucleotidyltransferase [Chloroflexota bacterium]MDP6665022.1 nucleotidyltransferase family protein [SAR202 cluster bacterium]HAL47286.1 nucleotidyltransferase [Dehalococcoidia bacterium]MDP6801486.1 nucleotidyltransferase family protein [SAR202 cluster bacterium]MQG59525.1 nucleotidyltransferase family protein [SAR202 cluster bacterium]|tara:strand:+ start:3416 stop:3715 length:300 start_codon:yes stop_codon:yes gene_type:complete
MERDEALKILSEHKAEFREKHGVKSIAIFGSTARDEARPDSDVDILVEFEPNAEIGLFEFVRFKRRLERTLNCQVDLTTTGGLVPQLRDRILEEAHYAR